MIIYFHESILPIWLKILIISSVTRLKHTPNFEHFF